MAELMRLQLTVNSVSHTLQVWPMERLLDVLRDRLHLTSAKEGCGEGECGACAVLIDGVLVNSCLVPALAAHGHSVQTVESFTHHPLAQAFHECGAAQCGICTPGMLLAGVKILQDHPQATEAEIREGLAGNLCRCTGYSAIVAAVKKVQQP